MVASVVTLLAASCSGVGGVGGGEGITHDPASDPASDPATGPGAGESQGTGIPLFDYTYPENPAESLKSALEQDFRSRSLPMEIGDVRRTASDGRERKEMDIGFSGSGNMCTIFFDIKALDYNLDFALDGHENPSFTIAFKDPDNPQDMVAVLASVIHCLAPGLDLGEAEGLAEAQDRTISVDGYSMPCEIAGYQVQARYTNPYDFTRVEGFGAKLGVRVTALKQIWGGFDPQGFEELKASQDYSILDARHQSAGRGQPVGRVYADFTVIDVWQHEEVVHGDSWEAVDVESMSGQAYSLRMDTTWRSAYEFGVGQSYTLYILANSYQEPEIVYAVQRSASSGCMSRGGPQPLEYPSLDRHDSAPQPAPDEGSAAFDVCFCLSGDLFRESFPVASGHGTGEAQWPCDPAREGYDFVGWFANEGRTGEPYTPGTPIHEDTSLYAKWRYTGAGGYWPRPNRGEVHGIEEGALYGAGQEITVMADGYNMDLGSPLDQRFRWLPICLWASGSAAADFTTETPFAAGFSIDEPGGYILLITYREEVFDGVGWQETGQIREVSERSFSIA